MDNKPMRLLIIEDDTGEAMKITECANRRKDITIIGITGSCEKGIEYVKSRLPDGVILDLQLAQSKGTGLLFLELLREAVNELSIYPIVVVTTTNKSKRVLERTEELGADFHFCKRTPGYSIDTVFDTLLSLRPTLHTVTGGMIVQNEALIVSKSNIESADDRRERIYNRIDIELDLIGVRRRYKGRGYIREAIFIQIHSKKDGGSGIEEVADMMGMKYPGVYKAMSTAITDVWNNADMEEVYKHYTALITTKSGVPYPTDFIKYYADKIGKSMG